ncbi:MAG: WecB/TagA/CpsF family glycosyltransferase [Verrucomicrobiota bacterium]
MKIDPVIPELAHGRSNVLGVGITPLNLELAQECLFAGANCPGFTGYVTITGVHGVMESQKDEELRLIHNRSFLSTPDGMPMVWMGRWNGYGHMNRVYGPEFMLNVFERSVESGHRHFLFGGAKGVASDLKFELEKRFPGSIVVGTRTPPFRPLNEAEELELMYEILETRPHFIWVGLSTPKQERFMASFLEKYQKQFRNWGQGLVFIGVGAAFDFHTGRISQAPFWVQRSGFEWLYRVCADPKRLWKRYAVNNARFIACVLPAMMGLKKYDITK